MSNWEAILLAIISARGGTARNFEIYEDLESGRFMSLEAHHIRESVHGGRPAYKHSVRSYLSKMVAKGELVSAGRGVHSLP